MSTAATDLTINSTEENTTGAGVLAPEVQRTMRLSIVEGSLTQVFLNWTTGAVLVGYLLHYNATPTQLAMAFSIPLLMQVAAPFAAWMESLFPRPKFLTILAAALGRTIWLFPALLTVFGISGEGGASFLLFFIGISFLFQSLATTVWSAWMGTIVPPWKRGQYFGTRNATIGVVGLLANLLAGRLLDVLPEPMNFQLVIFLAVLMAAAGIYLYSFHYEPQDVTPLRLNLVETFRVPLRDANFRRMVAFGVYWHASVLLASPFLFAYFLEHLEMNFTQIALFSATAALTALVFGPRWGRLADRVGNRALLSISTFLAGSIIPICWMVASPGTLFPIYLSGFLEGLVWSALTPAIFNLTLATSPQENRIAYLGVFSMCIGIGGFLGGLMAGPLLHFFQQHEIVVADFHWSGYHWLFLVSCLARTQAWRFVRRVEESHSWHTRDVLRLARHYRFIGLPWR